ncbi:peptide-methionine (S)-S-oxide reductase MsrA [Corynebacterium crudilactis]|uniref:Peptide methionine sulfoxide reductase MsrA n=1 Tax=Corynebacterium crudilactis TaxID=1652495 RepID=A0A172QWJ2_9CORY|nr:peptide-methionine (S)-S-oxide reductase MsrA [Corynebacterium crudilactis]ANE05084.1 peptide-methionine (S)-S-oxide reductase [Corynebacterium crudilactis]
MAWFFAPEPVMVTPEEALKGGRHPVLETPAPHTVLGTPITGPWKEEQQRIWIGLGCFWGVEQMYWKMDGVEGTSVGYAGGYTPNPTYREVCSGRTGHTEIVEVVYDPTRVSLEQLVARGLEAHDPTQGFRQGNDVGTQYRSAYFTDNEEDAARVKAVVDAYGQTLAQHGFGAITTEIGAISPAEYFLAEDYHQQYLDKNPEGYCPHHSTGIPCGVEA